MFQMLLQYDYMQQKLSLKNCLTSYISRRFIIQNRCEIYWQRLVNILDTLETLLSQFESMISISILCLVNLPYWKVSPTVLSVRSRRQQGPLRMPLDTLGVVWHQSSLNSWLTCLTLKDPGLWSFVLVSSCCRWHSSVHLILMLPPDADIDFETSARSLFQLMLELCSCVSGWSSVNELRRKISREVGVQKHSYFWFKK